MRSPLGIVVLGECVRVFGKCKLLIVFSSCVRRAFRVRLYGRPDTKEADMQKVLVLVLGLTAIAAHAAPAVGAETIELSSDWNSIGEQPDRCAPGLTGRGVPPKWAIVKTQPGAKLGIAETSADETDYRFPLCIVDGAAFASLGNLDVSVRFRPMAGRVDQAGGIAIRVKDPLNYYVVRANALEDNVRLYAVIDGDRKQFAGSNIKVASQQWHTLRLRAVGDRFTVFFDGAQLFEAADKRIAAPGGVALWSKADSVTEFVDLAIEPLP
jgi:hypothetical protein